MKHEWTVSVCVCVCFSTFIKESCNYEVMIRREEVEECEEGKKIWTFFLWLMSRFFLITSLCDYFFCKFNSEEMQKKENEKDADFAFGKVRIRTFRNLIISLLLFNSRCYYDFLLNLNCKDIHFSFKFILFNFCLNFKNNISPILISIFISIWIPSKELTFIRLKYSHTSFLYFAFFPQ